MMYVFTLVFVMDNNKNMFIKATNVMFHINPSPLMHIVFHQKGVSIWQLSK